MECNKLGKQIQDWARNLGFVLADGSAPPPSYFASLAATPHRRQLWEGLVNSVQSRKKIEFMRKQILVAKLLKNRKYLEKTTVKQQADKLDLWQEQNKLEVELKEKETAVIKLEADIMMKASDTVFEICKLSELEKQLEEFSEKSLVLKLLSKRKKKIKEDLESCMLKVEGTSLLNDDLKKSVENVISCCTKNELLSAPECECPSDGTHTCSLFCKIEDLCKFGVSEQALWEEVIKLKRILLDKFSEFLEDLNSNEKSVLSDKKSKIEKSLNLSVTQLKQNATEKSLQILINSTEGKLLEVELQGLENRVLDELLRKPPVDVSLNESLFSLASNEMSKSAMENEKTEKNFKKYINTIGLQSYQEFLKEELTRLNEMVKVKTNDEKEDTKGGTEELQMTLNTFDSIIKDINSFTLERNDVEKEIFRLYDQFQGLQDSLEKEFQRRNETATEVAEDAAHSLKLASEKQIALLLETPSDAFRTVETSSGRTLFERESPSHCLRNYGGELKQFFSTMLIPPSGDVQKVLLEVERRQKIIKELKSFLSERQNLAEMQKKIKHQLSSINYDRKLCERNFTKSEGILWNILRKTDELFEEVVFIEKILKNWVEQPYEMMIKETSAGKSFREFEEKYKKGNK